MPVYAGRWWVGFQAAGTFSPADPGILWIARNISPPAEIRPEFTEDQSPILEGPLRSMPTDAHLFGIDRVAQRSLFRYENVVVSELDAGVAFNGPLNVRVTNESIEPLYIGMIRVRSTVYPYPTVTRGATQP